MNIRTRSVIHHAHGGDGEIATRIARDGTVQLDPPGIALDVLELFSGLRGNAAAR